MEGHSPLQSAAPQTLQETGWQEGVLDKITPDQ